MRSLLERALAGFSFEFSELGLYCHRLQRLGDGLRKAEQILLSDGPLRVLDFTHGEDLLSENVVSVDDSTIASYKGAGREKGYPCFRVDHHYQVPCLSQTSSTPLTLRWIRELWKNGEHEILKELAGSRFLADHCDTDILLSNHLALHALDEAWIHSKVGEWFSAAALRNDYIQVPAEELEPQASQVFYACLGIEDEILGGNLSFARAQSEWLPGLSNWVSGQPEKVSPIILEQLKGFDAQMRAKEESTIAQIADCEKEGKLTWELADRLAILEINEKIDNADFYLYLAKHNTFPMVQILIYPDLKHANCFIYKIRAHKGFDLHSLFRALNRLAPEAGFGGRASAGGSLATPAIVREDLLKVVETALDSFPKSYSAQTS